MRTAIDTNVISALWSREPTASRMVALLAEACSVGSLVICAPVYAELRAHPTATADFVDGFLAETGVLVDYELGQELWLDAAAGFATYAQRRRRSGGSPVRRLLVDFVVGAHAYRSADRLLTLDPSIYALDFPQLKLIP